MYTIMLSGRGWSSVRYARNDEHLVNLVNGARATLFAIDDQGNEVAYVQRARGRTRHGDTVQWERWVEPGIMERELARRMEA